MEDSGRTESLAFGLFFQNICLLLFFVNVALAPVYLMLHLNALSLIDSFAGIMIYAVAFSWSLQGRQLLASWLVAGNLLLSCILLSISVPLQIIPIITLALSAISLVIFPPNQTHEQIAVAGLILLIGTLETLGISPLNTLFAPSFNPTELSRFEVTSTIICTVVVTGIIFYSFKHAHRTYQQEQDYLRERLALVEEKSKLRNQFMLTMSHEIRTPLSGIVGALSLIDDTALSAEQRSILSTARYSSQILADIVSDILLHMRHEQGRLELFNDVFSPIECAEKLLQLLRFDAKSKRLNITAEFSSTVPNQIIADERKIKQIILNLMGNAIKYTERGEVKLSIYRQDRKEVERHAQLVIEVADTGIGIPPDKLETIFEPFTQIDSQLSRQHEGTGLGLSITKQLIDVMGGSISVVSTLGKGSTFSVYLPFDIDMELKPKAIAKTLTIDKICAENLSVLVVEDNEINQLVIEQQLLRLGVQVDIADNGIDGFLKAQVTVYDCIFMDMHMPKMNGIETTEKIRSELPYQPVIIGLTANVLEEDHIICLQAGMQQVLTKPVSKQQLIDALALVLEHRRSSDRDETTDKPKNI